MKKVRAVDIFVTGMSLGLAIAAVLIANLAHAQPAAPPPSPFEQALEQKLNAEIGEDLQDKTALVAERQKNSELEKRAADLQKQLDTLRPKPAPDEKKAPPQP